MFNDPFAIPLNNNDLAIAWLIQRLTIGSSPTYVVERLTGSQAARAEESVGRTLIACAEKLHDCGLPLEAYAERAKLVWNIIGMAHLDFVRILDEVRPQGSNRDIVTADDVEGVHLGGGSPADLGPDHDPQGVTGG